jgi:ATP-dependent Zn protease
MPRKVRQHLKFRRPQDRRATAVHEAGHAVIGRLLGLICGDVTIVRDTAGGTEGYATCADPWLTQGIWDKCERYRYREVILRSRIVTYAAGREAEEEILGTCRGGDGDDQTQIAYMLDSLGIADEALAGNEVRLRKRARALVRRHRAVIEGVAEQLLSRGALRSDEIDAIVNETSGSRVRFPLAAVGA